MRIEGFLVDLEHFGPSIEREITANHKETASISGGDPETTVRCQRILKERGYPFWSIHCEIQIAP